jgi:hypothetical protein
MPVLLLLTCPTLPPIYTLWGQRSIYHLQKLLILSSCRHDFRVFHQLKINIGDKLPFSSLYTMSFTSILIFSKPVFLTFHISYQIFITPYTFAYSYSNIDSSDPCAPGFFLHPVLYSLSLSLSKAYNLLFKYFWP